MTTNTNVELKTFKEIQQYSSNFYKELYSKVQCNVEKQDHFLSFITNGLSVEDRAITTKLRLLGGAIFV